MFIALIISAFVFMVTTPKISAFALTQTVDKIHPAALLLWAASGTFIFLYFVR